MPATDVSWVLSPPVGPVYPVYRCKRKNQLDLQCEMDDSRPKRPCLEGFGITPCTAGPTDMESSDQMASVTLDFSNTNTAGPMRVPPFPDQSLIHHGIGCADSMREENNNSQSWGQDEMIMDLMDECYSTASLPIFPSPSQQLPPTGKPTLALTDAEYEAACFMVSAMESEGAPDPHQYQVQQTNESSCRVVNLESGCMPIHRGSSVDSLQDTVPYISDYY